MLISDHHRELYRRYYAQKEVKSRPSVWLPRIEKLAAGLGATSVIDYGCGAARGVSMFSRLHVTDYDPCVPGCDREPQAADLVVSIHAIEHVEPAMLDSVFAHMESLARLAVLVVISCEPSTKLLPDGTPWHSCVFSAEEWLHLLPRYQRVDSIKDPAKEFAAVWRR